MRRGAFLPASSNTPVRRTKQLSPPLQRWVGLGKHEEVPEGRHGALNLKTRAGMPAPHQHHIKKEGRP